LLASIGYHGLCTTLVGSLVKAKARAERLKFVRKTRAVARTQREVLLDKVRRCAESDFGRDHHFARVDSIRSFRANVPVATFEYFEPYVRKVVEGRPEAMLAPGEQVLMFALTSGTTASAKHIPVSRRFLKDYQTGWLIWGAFVLDNHPHAFELSVAQVVSSSREGTVGHGIPCGSISGLIAQMQPAAVRALYAVPAELADASDAESKYYAVSLLTLAGRTSLFTTANPSTLIACARTTEKHIERIIRDIADGTLSSECRLEAPIREAVERRLKKRPDRARRLELAVRDGNTALGALIDSLQVVACWKGGTLRRYLDLFPKYFPGVPVRDIGLIASEGRMSIPFTDEGSLGILDIGSHFFEFIPREEGGSERPTVLLAHELEIGAEYFILLTTSSGLFRYNICDVVRVADFFNEAPVIEFRNKGSHFSSLTGEKLAEAQVVEAMGVVNDRMNLKVHTFTLCPCWHDERPGYRLLVERDSLEAKIAEAVCQSLDRELCRINLEYASKRKSHRLAPVTVKFLEVGAFDEYRRRTVAQRGGRLEQFKHVFLTQDETFAAHLGAEPNGGKAE